jgi:hypothetical protein
MRRSSILRTAGIILVSVGAVGAAGALVVRDQLTRHQRNLFSPAALKRLAALGYLSGAPASVELVQVLRDYASWEQNSVLRRRALNILTRMEQQLRTNGGSAASIAG